MDIILKATVAQVPVGAIEVEGLLLETGEFAISIPQANALISFSTHNNYASQALKRLLGGDFSPHKVRIKGLKQLINCVLIKDFEKLLLEVALTGNQKAIELSRALIGLSLQQLFSDAFNIQFEKEDRQQWLKARMRGKVVRRTLTDAIKSWYERNPTQTSKPEWLMYAETTNLIYQALWGVDALQLESKIGCKRNKSRDYLADSSLAELERAEANVCDVIDCDNIKPCDAVSVARIRNKMLLLKDI